MNPFFGSVFWLLVTLGVLVTFHEFGHFWVARRCGVKVLRFSVGFGRAIWKRVARDGTEYRVAMIPLGGYVKMLDAREGEVEEALRGQEFTGKPVWKRIAIVVAGPAANLLFALAAFWLMFMIGRPDAVPVVDAAPQSLAAQAGVRDGDRILAVDGRAVSTWSGVTDELVDSLLGREPLALTVRGRDGGERRLTLPLDRLPAGQDVGQYLDRLGLGLAGAAPVVGSLVPGLPAARAGLAPGDVVVSINGQPVADFPQMQRVIGEQAANSPALAFVVRRDGRELPPITVNATRQAAGTGTERWVVGVGSQAPETAILRYGPLRSLRESLATTWGSAAQTFRMIGKMLTGEASTRNLSGVIGIAQVANQTASMGPAWFLNFLGMVSLSLCILNLLPIPLLDGGHLLYYLIELVKGSPVSERAMVAGQYVGLALLFTMMGLAFYNDIHRILLS